MPSPGPALRAHPAATGPLPLRPDEQQQDVDPDVIFNANTFGSFSAAHVQPQGMPLVLSQVDLCHLDFTNE